MGQFMFFAVLLGLIAIAFAISTLWQSSRKLAVALVLGLPLCAGGLYLLKGNPAALDAGNVLAPTGLQDAVAQLKTRLAKEPDSFAGWVLLSRSQMALENFGEARDAFAKAVALEPDEADVGVEYAEALMRTSSDHRFPPEAVALLETARAKNPQNQRALFFLGMHQRQSDQPADAAATWEKLLPLLAPEAAMALRQQIADARIAAKLPPLPEPAPGSTVQVTLRIDPTLANLAKPGDTLYVFARSADGKGPPLAVKRLLLEKLPVEVSLSDADSPMPAARLSTQKTVVLMARLSRSGDAVAGSGDIEADPVTVVLADGKPVQLNLSRVRP